MKSIRHESALDQEMKSPSFGAAFAMESAALEVSEFIAKQMTEQAVSARSLARLASVSPTVVQGIKSGKRKNIAYATLKALAIALGYQITFTRMQSTKQ